MLADFPERILLHDFAAAEGVEIVPPHLDGLTVSLGTTQRPLRGADVTFAMLGFEVVGGLETFGRAALAIVALIVS